MGFFSKQSSVDIAVIGLGNVGKQYESTRHNMGFCAVDALAEKLDAPIFKTRKQGLESKVSLQGKKVLLVKPTTFMNASGNCVKDVQQFYKLTPQQIIVIYDDIDLDAGALRLRASGGAGTHKGMRSIVPAIGEGFARVRVGIGKPEHGDLADYVLGKIPKDAQCAMQKVIDAAAEAVIVAISSGLDKAMQQYNSFKA